MISNYISQCKICDSIITLDSIKDIQGEVDKAVSRVVNTKYSSQKNDLGIKINEQSALRLTWYNSILENVAHCNKCFEEYEIEDIIDLVETEITKSRN